MKWKNEIKEWRKAFLHDADQKNAAMSLRGYSPWAR